MKSFNILTQYLLRNCNPKGQPSIIEDQNFEYQITIKIIFNIHMIMVMSRLRPLDTGRKLDVQMTLRVSSERLMYVQFTSCIQGVVPFNIYINKISIFISKDIHKYNYNSHNSKTCLVSCKTVILFCSIKIRVKVRLLFGNNFQFKNELLKILEVIN